MSAIVQTEGLVKRFGELAAVDDVSVSLEEGRLTAIIGPNGAGKTTFINVLSGALTPDSGRVLFHGRDVTGLAPHALVRLGLTRSFQIMNLFPGLTVEENVLLPIMVRRGTVGRTIRPFAKDAAARDEAADVLRSIGLIDQRGLPARLLSHGDQRLLELGIAVAAKPKLCFLDEPTSGMNPRERRAVLELVRWLAENKTTTFVIVEHDMDVVFALAEHVCVLNRGRLLAQGGPEAIRQDPKVREVYLGEELEA